MFDIRVRKLKDNIKKAKIDAVFISSHPAITYLSGYSNFSKDEREAYIFVGENFQYIITDGRHSQAIKKQVSHLKLFERGNKKSTEDLIKRHAKEIKKLAIEEEDLTIAEDKILKKHFKNLKNFDMKLFRSVKSNDEIDKIKKAAELGDKTFEYIIKKVKPGISEKQLAFEIEFFIKKNGGDLSFPPIVAFGKNSSMPHHQTGEDVLGPETSSGQEGQIVLLDFGVKLENYCSDMTRTVFFGKPTGKQTEIYRAVLEAQQKTVDVINKQIKSGKKIKASDLDKVARDYIVSKGYPTIPHSLGHGIGLEVHEHPSLSLKSKEVLKEGMVFSIEPGIYISGFGGIRIEDLYVLEKKDLRQLTNSLKEIIEI